MVLPQMQRSQVSEEIAKHLPKSKNIDFAFEKIQTKRRIQKIKELIFSQISLWVEHEALCDKSRVDV